MQRALIIDDEQIGINALSLLIERYCPEIKVVSTATDPQKGIALIEDYMPEIVFLDISMPKMNAFELLDQLKFRTFKLVFTTAHQEYAIQAIKNKAYDYLLKPIDIEELKTCVKNIVEGIEKGNEKKLPNSNIELHVKDGIIFIKQEDIIRLEADGSYAIFYLENNVRHVASKNLKECEALLDLNLFYRCHASHIINLKKVVKMVSTDGLFARMSDGSMPEISRRNKEAFLEKLKTI